MTNYREHLPDGDRSMTALANTYCQAGKLPCGAEIYLWGNRRVVDVHNVGNPNYVRLVTSDGTFELPRDTWIAPAGSSPRQD